MMGEIAVVLVEPEYGLNIGYVARTMKNFGVRELYIVGRTTLPPSAFRFCSHARDILENVQFVKDFGEIVKKFDFVIGTTARTAIRSANVIRKAITPEEALKYLNKFGKVALVLGRDTTGLRNEELALCDIVVNIPTGTEYPTLNISHALAILLYVFLRRRVEGEEKEAPSRREREQLTAYIDLIMEKINFPKYRRLRVTKTFNKVAISTELKREDIVTILGFLRRILINLEEKNH